MAMEPPPNIMTPGRITGKIRTGAKTAPKDQEREYLARFQRLAEDPAPLLPEWKGPGSDPFAGTRRKLRRVQAKKDSGRWLKWYARGKKLHNAYATTLLVLRGGKIPSFASIKFQGRDLKFVVRGRGQQNVLAFVQNHEDVEARLLGFLDWARRGGIVIVSHDAVFFGTRAGHAFPPETLATILADHEIAVESTDGVLRCSHVDLPRAQVEYALADLGARIRLCRACIEKAKGNLEAALERNILAPSGKIRVRRTPTGRPYRVHPESLGAELERLVADAAQRAERKSRDYEDVTDLDLLDWTTEALMKLLEDRADGYLLAGEDLWLGAYDQAAAQFAGNEMDRTALTYAFSLVPPRHRTSEPSLTKLLSGVWPTKALDILRHCSGGALPEADLAELAQKPPADALPALIRRMETHHRFREFPAFEPLPPPLQLAHDLFKARKTDDASLFQQRLGAGVQSRETRSLALALARVYNASTGLEWQYAPHEKDEAKFLEPYARELAFSHPETFEESLSKLAAAMNVPPPRRKG